MSLDDAFERCLELLYEAALDDARWPAATSLIEEAAGFRKNALMVGEGFGSDARFYFARFLELGDSREDLGREYMEADKSRCGARTAYSTGYFPKHAHPFSFPMWASMWV